jgi:hypothetical protein
MGRKDFKLPYRVSMGFGEKRELNLDMNLLALKVALPRRRTTPVLPELVISGRLKPWPLSYAPVIAITDSISFVQKNLSL